MAWIVAVEHHLNRAAFVPLRQVNRLRIHVIVYMCLFKDQLKLAE